MTVRGKHTPAEPRSQAIDSQACDPNNGEFPVGPFEKGHGTPDYEPFIVINFIIMLSSSR